MTPEIEALKKLAAGTINKGKLPAITAALKAAQDLVAKLEPKSDSEDDTTEFEDDESDLESALDDLESACDELEMAEEKDERDEAIEGIEIALGEVIANLETLMKVAIIGEVDWKSINLELGAKLKEITIQPGADLHAALTPWVDDSPTDVIKRARKKAVQKLQEMMLQVMASKSKN